jgi:hypothetical protein
VILASILAASSVLAVNWQWSAPPWAARAFEEAGIGLGAEGNERLVLATHVNPVTLFGDFDGDQRTDVAVLVREKSSIKLGIAVARQGAEVVVLGAGKVFGNGGDDFGWLDHWYTFTRDRVSPGADESAPPTLLGDALWVEKSESASALIYWTGSDFAWYQQGD